MIFDPHIVHLRCAFAQINEWGVTDAALFYLGYSKALHTVNTFTDWYNGKCDYSGILRVDWSLKRQLSIERETKWTPFQQTRPEMVSKNLPGSRYGWTERTSQTLETCLNTFVHSRDECTSHLTEIQWRGNFIQIRAARVAYVRKYVIRWGGGIVFCRLIMRTYEVYAVHLYLLLSWTLDFLGDWLRLLRLLSRPPFACLSLDLTCLRSLSRERERERERCRSIFLSRRSPSSSWRDDNTENGLTSGTVGICRPAGEKVWNLYLGIGDSVAFWHMPGNPKCCLDPQFQILIRIIPPRPPAIDSGPVRGHPVARAQLVGHPWARPNSRTLKA